MYGVDKRDKGYRGVGIWIFSPGLEWVILQRKFDHPIPDLNGKLCAFGGGIEDGEKPMQALMREMQEEFHVRVCNILMTHLEARGCQSLRYDDFPHPLDDYQVIEQHMVIIELDRDEWTRLIHEIDHGNRVYEGRAMLRDVKPGAPIWSQRSTFMRGHFASIYSFLEAHRPIRVLH